MKNGRKYLSFQSMFYVESHLHMRFGVSQARKIFFFDFPSFPIK